MRKIKKKRNNQPQLINEQSNYSVKSMIIIILIVIVVFIGFYFLTTVVVKNQNNNVVEDEIVNKSYQSEKITFGQMLTRKDTEYYVYAYDENSKFYELYNQYLTNYNEKEEKIPVYLIDLNDGMNRSYVGDKTVVGPDLKSLKVNGITLFKIKDGVIEEYYTNSSDISNELKKISE